MHSALNATDRYALCVLQVAHGSTHDPNDDGPRGDPYAVPKAMGIFVELESKVGLTVDAIVSRIHKNHERLEAKVSKKMQVEREYYDHRYGFAEEEQ